MVYMTTMTEIPRGSIVRYRNAVGPSLYLVVYDFGAIGAHGSCFCEVEPFPNIFNDDPVMVPSKALELVDPLESDCS
jgi:hypothetical protein